jgi:hypothetical protein
MDVEVDPPQPEEVVRALAEAVELPAKGPDPWWQAGVAENLET